LRMEFLHLGLKREVEPTLLRVRQLWSAAWRPLESPPQGHAAPSGDWHYHSGEFGLVTDIASIPSTKLIGYAMDGFPI
jgi:hypothetical protein